jgi:hypothetical protein
MSIAIKLASFGFATLVAFTVSPRWGAQVPPPASLEPPADLIKSIVPGNAAKAYYADLERAWFDWDTLDKTVTVTRRERQLVTDAWSEQIQELRTGYYVVDVRAMCGGATEITSLFVAGIYATGESCIERWTFATPLLNGPYGTMDRRKPPAVRKTELFRGAQYGHIRCLEPDPDGRFVLFLTYDNPTLYRLPLNSGSISIELSQSTVPELADARSVYAEQHVTEGRQFQLLRSSRWEADMDASRLIIILKDGNNDAVFDAPTVLTPVQWSQQGYDEPGVWLSPCP